MGQVLTVERIIFDAIGIDPVCTSHREQSVGCSVQRANEARAITGREVRLEVERAGSTSLAIRVDRLYTPILDGWVVEEQIPREREFSRIQS